MRNPGLACELMCANVRSGGGMETLNKPSTRRWHLTFWRLAPGEVQKQQMDGGPPLTLTLPFLRYVHDFGGFPSQS